MTTPSRSSFISTGSFKELVHLFFPILLMTFSGCLFIFVEKLFLVRISVKAMESAVYVTYACQIFQMPSIALAAMAQIFVGRWLGAKDFKMVGPGIWQFIWFSFLSLLVTIPVNLLYGIFYFRNRELEESAMTYFYLLIAMNFLFPLSTSLSCFYFEQGKTRLIVFATLVSQALILFLAYLLIFGAGQWLPPLGLIGGALSTFIAQGSFCILLFAVFLNAKEAHSFNIRDWKL